MNDNYVTDSVKDFLWGLLVAVIVFSATSTFNHTTFKEFVLFNIDSIIISCLFTSLLSHIVLFIRLKKDGELFIKLKVIFIDLSLISIFVFIFYRLILCWKSKLTPEGFMELALSLYDSSLFWLTLAALLGLGLATDIKLRQTNYFIQKATQRKKDRTE